MRPFYSKDGRLITPRPHEAYFRGKYNASKAKVLIYLLYLHRKGDRSGKTAQQIHDATGVSFEYLKSRLTFWYHINYLRRSAFDPGRGRSLFIYRIDERGIRFVDERIPPDRYSDYVREINEWRQNNAKGS
jgi:predicted ArsR family transcriptional regulator